MKTSISVITATYNAGLVLPMLIESLRSQSDKDFQWVVADGASDDGTLALLDAINDLDLLVLSQPDFGIYDALNRAIKASRGDYYIVCGADDVFYSDAMAVFKKAIEDSNAEVITAQVKFDQAILKPNNSAAWLWGHRAYIAMHTVATVFQKNLHHRFGYYSRKYPIAADQLFVMAACDAGARRYHIDYIAGEIGINGVSSIDRVGNATEVFRVQLALGRSRLLQGLLLFLRLLRA